MISERKKKQLFSYAIYAVGAFVIGVIVALGVVKGPVIFGPIIQAMGSNVSAEETVSNSAVNLVRENILSDVGYYFDETNGVAGNFAGDIFHVESAQSETESVDESDEIYVDYSEFLVIPDEGDEKSKDELQYIVKRGGVFPRIIAKSILVADIDTGDIIAARNIDDVYPIASITKLMTALVAAEDYDPEDIVTISNSAINTYGYQGRLRAGQEYTVSDLMYPLLLESSNDAAEALAEHNGRAPFLNKMNERALQLGMTATSYDDASGLSQFNISSAQDLMTLMKHISQNNHDIFDITQLKQYEHEKITWYNNSRYRNDVNFIGGKNGYTDEAGKTQVAMFRLPLEGEFGFRNIAMVILNSPDTTKDIRAITDFLNEYVYLE